MGTLAGRRYGFGLLLGLVLLLLLVAIYAGPARAQPPALAHGQIAAGTAVTLEGEIEILHQDFRKFGRYLYFLQTSDGRRITLHFAKHPPTNLLTGDHVRVSGQQSGETLLLASGGSTSVTPLTATVSATAPLPNTFGAQVTAVILVNFQDNPTAQPWTPTQVQSAIFGSAGASGFFLENSYGQTSLTGNVFGWYTIPVNSTTCDMTQIATAANNAATSAGVNLASYTHLVYAFSSNSACGFAGSATVGGNPSQAWLNDHIDLGIVAHELGHNLGLYHSHGMLCGSTVIGTSCTVYEYANLADVMGNLTGHYNAFQKDRLGWLNYGTLPPITTVQASGTYTLDPYEPTGSKPKALKILKSVDPTTGLSTWYYVEYRQPLGFDSALSTYVPNSNLTQGVLVHIGTDSSPNSSDLLDTTPNSYTYDFDDAALVPGQSFTDPNAGVTIATSWVNATNAGVSVTLTTPCTHTNPTVAVSPASSTPASAGTAVTYTLSITNNDNSICTASSFNLAATVASGWSAAFGSSALTLNPGASASTSLTVTSAASAAAGLYSVGVSAQNASTLGYTGSASATYEVAPTVSVSTNSASYNQGNSVYVTTIVTSGGSSVPGSSVNCAVTGPSGTKMSASATTGTNGTTTLTFKLKRSAPKGIYQVLATASANGVSGSGATNFTVQ